MHWRSARFFRSTALVLALAALTTACGVAASQMSSDPVSPTDGLLRLVDSYDLPGPPMALAFRDARTGYLAMANGDILRVDIDRAGSVRWRRAAHERAQPRSVVVSDDTLFVSEIELPCRDVSPDYGLVRCRVEEFPSLPKAKAAAKLLADSHGRVRAFPIDDDGALGQPRTIVDDLPVADSDHAVNGLAPGKDGKLYLSIAQVDGIFNYPQAVSAIPSARADLLGTIVRFEPDGTDLEVFARGTRNVFGLTFDDGGRLYGVDNDGPSAHGWRFEEVDRFRKGAHYGYPDESTLGPRKVRTGEPLWILDAVGSSGIEWGPRAGLPDGLVIGSCGKLTFLEFFGLGVRKGSEVALGEPNGCVPVVRATPTGHLVVATMGPNKLFVYRARERSSASR